MTNQPSAGAGRLNDVAVTPECARLFYTTFMYAASFVMEDTVRRPKIEAAMLAAFDDVDPVGPFKPLMAELKRIAGIGSGK
jgi:hypothetical protein